MTGAILITRPEQQAREFATILEAEDYKTVCVPLLEKNELDFSVPSLPNVQAIIFTSANAVMSWAAKSHDRSVDVYTVGEQTRHETEKAGFESILSAAGNVKSLEALILSDADKESGSLIYVGAVHQSGQLSEKLSEAGFEVVRIQVYEMKKTENLSEDILKKIQKGEISYITFFSRRTAESFVGAIRKAGTESALQHIKALCISDAVIECIQDLPWQGTYSAKTPDRDGMLHLIREVAET